MTAANGRTPVPGQASYPGYPWPPERAPLVLGETEADVRRRRQSTPASQADVDRVLQAVGELALELRTLRLSVQRSIGADKARGTGR